MICSVEHVSSVALVPGIRKGDRYEDRDAPLLVGDGSGINGVASACGFGSSAREIPVAASPSTTATSSSLPAAASACKINLSTTLADQRIGIKQVDDAIWLVGFMSYDLVYIDLFGLDKIKTANTYATEVAI